MEPKWWLLFSLRDVSLEAGLWMQLGILAAFIAAGTAWVAVKQFSPLASAYSVATKELAVQASKLEMVAEPEWSLFVADAEEAISREHTTWLASRTGKFPLPS